MEQRIKMSKKSEYIRFKSNERKMKSWFTTFAGFESILVPENNDRQNPNESYTDKYKKHVTCSYGYKLLGFVDDKLSKPSKSYFGEDAVTNFINSKAEESKYCS